jgi:hypothetical protein
LLPALQLPPYEEASSSAMFKGAASAEEIAKIPKRRRGSGTSFMLKKVRAATL